MKNKFYAKFGRGCLFVSMDRVSRSITVADPGEGSGSPLFFEPNWGPKKNFFQTTTTLSKGLNDCPPPSSQGLDPALNKLVFEGQLQRTPNRGDMLSIRKQYLLQLAHLRKPPYITVSLKTRRRLNPFLYRFLQFLTLLSVVHIPCLSLYALLKFSLGTWRKIGSLLSRFPLMPDYLKKLN